MNSVTACILGKIESLGEVSPEIRKELNSVVKNLEKHGTPEAILEGKLLVEDMETGLQSVVMKAYNKLNVMDELNTVRNVVADQSSGKWESKIFGQKVADAEALTYRTSDVYRRNEEAIFGDMATALADVWHHIQSKHFGVGAKVQSQWAVKSLYGEIASPEAQLFKEKLNELQKVVNAHRIEAGLKPLSKEFKAPINLSTHKLFKVGVDEFKALVRNSADMDTLTKSAKAHINKFDTFDEYLEAVHDAFVYGTRGAEGDRIKFEELRNSFTDGFFPKSSDSWMKIDEVLGEGSFHAGLLGILKSNSVQVARAKTFGGNKFYLKQVEKHVDDIIKERGWSPNKKATLMNNLTTYVDYSYGAYSRAMAGESGASKAANWLVATLGNVNIASMLGSVVLKALTSDTLFGSLARKASGFKNTYKNLTGLDKVVNYKESFADAIRRGSAAQAIMEELTTATRIMDAAGGATWSKDLAKFIMDISGLNRWTQTKRWGSHENTIFEIAQFTKKSFSELDPKTQRIVQNHGISEGDWKAIQGLTHDLGDGTKNIILQELFNGNLKEKTLARKLSSLAYGIMEFEVPTSSTRFTARRAKWQKDGGIGSALVDSVFQFAGWPTSVIQNHILRPLKTEGLSMLGFRLTMFGMMGILAQFGNDMVDVVNGKNPMSFKDPQRWYRGYSEAVPFIVPMILGALEVTDDRKKLEDAFGAPLNTGLDLLRAARSTIMYPFLSTENQEKHIRKAVKGLQKTLPSVWYMKPFIDRFLKDQAFLFMAPDAYSDLETLNRRQQRKGGYWWRRGEMSPNSAPDFSTYFKEVE